MTAPSTRVVPVEAIKSLTEHQEQLDMDGCMVGVSRQALDETLAYVAALNAAPAPRLLPAKPLPYETPEDGKVYVLVTGLTGVGKSAVLGEIEIAMLALGLSVETDDAHANERNCAHADWQSALDLYQPTVVLTERNISRKDPSPAAPVQGEGDAVAWRDMSECPRDDRMVLAKRADGAMMVWRADILMHSPTPAHLDFKATGWIGCEELDAILTKGGRHG